MTKIEQKIPEGWSVKKLGDCCSFMGGGTPSRATLDFFNGSIPWVKTTDLNNSLLYKTEENISELGLNSSSCKIISKGAVCVAMYGGFNQIGRTCLLGMNAAVNQAITAIIPSHILSNKYLLTYLNFNVHQWKKFAGSSRKDPNITKQDITFFQILLPPLPEQEKISEVLSCWDNGIEKLSALIEKKKIQKKALMQQLLTGKHRLKGFSEPWKEVKLGDVFSIKKGQGLSKEELNPLGENACILYGELYTTYNEVIYNIKSLTNVESGVVSQVGDILIPASTTTTGIDLANASALMVSGILLGGDINILRCKIQNSPIFFAYLLTHVYKYEIAKLAQGITIVHLYGEFIKKIKVFTPSDLAEQTAIAEILSKADEEIELLNKKLEAFKQEKKALMQQLLTGKIRVKVN